jgi:3-methylcrotonyl-CoA carboxylase alpha subunit
MPSADVLSATALCVLTDEAETAARDATLTADRYSPWNVRDHWWLNVAYSRELRFIVGDDTYPVIVRRADPAWLLTIGDRALTATATPAPDGRLDITLDGVRERITAMRHGETIIVRRNGETHVLGLPDPIAAGAEEDDAGGRLVAPIPGQVTQVLAEAGTTVTRGQVLVVLEAMKTVFRLAAPADGTIATVSCSVGDSVVEGQLLVGFAE